MKSLALLALLLAVGCKAQAAQRWWECLEHEGGRWPYDAYTGTQLEPASARKALGFTDCRSVPKNYTSRNKHLECPIIDTDGAATKLIMDGVACPDPGVGPPRWPWTTLAAWQADPHIEMLVDKVSRFLEPLEWTDGRGTRHQVRWGVSGGWTCFIEEPGMLTGEWIPEKDRTEQNRYKICASHYVMTRTEAGNEYWNVTDVTTMEDLLK